MSQASSVHSQNLKDSRSRFSIHIFDKYRNNYKLFLSLHNVINKMLLRKCQFMFDDQKGRKKSTLKDVSVIILHDSKSSLLLNLKKYGSSLAWALKYSVMRQTLQ